MLSRLLSTLLVVLITSPFSAPFSTCDIATMLPSGHARNQSHAKPTRVSVTRDIGNSALIPLRFNARRIARMHIRALVDATPTTSMDVRSASTESQAARRHVSSPLRI
jgi:hypothetical protein